MSATAADAYLLGAYQPKCYVLLGVLVAAFLFTGMLQRRARRALDAQDRPRTRFGERPPRPAPRAAKQSAPNARMTLPTGLIFSEDNFTLNLGLFMLPLNAKRKTGANTAIMKQDFLR